MNQKLPNLEHIEEMIGREMELPPKEVSSVSVAEAMNDLSNKALWKPHGTCLIPTPINPIYEEYMSQTMVNC